MITSSENLHWGSEWADGSRHTIPINRGNRRSPMSRVVVTGIGTVCPLGNNVPTFWRRLLQGESGIGRLSRIDVSDLPCQIGGEIRELPNLPALIQGRVARHLDRASLFAVHAAVEAVADAGIDLEGTRSRCGVILGAGLSGLDTLQEQTTRLIQLGPRQVSPFTIPTLMPNASAANISLAFGLSGPSYTVSSACASSGHALIDAAELIRRGVCDCVITGGTESSLTRLGMAAFCQMKALATGYNDNPSAAVRPFDADRSGLVMSEGSAVLILESADHAISRGARIHAEVLGHGTTSDAHDIVRPDPNPFQAAAAIRRAMELAGRDSQDIASRTYVNAHGTGTRLNDRIETAALKQAFGADAERLQISSTKSMTGHLIGAASSLESIACIQSLKDQVLPPTINLTTPDPECDLDYIPGRARAATVDFALNNSFGFGGHNVALLFSRWTSD